jgi:hypothetical protein
LLIGLMFLSRASSSRHAAVMVAWRSNVSPDAGADPGAVAHGGDRLVPEREGRPYRVDRILQDAGHAVVVLRGDEDVGVAFLDRLVLRLHDRAALHIGAP